ncbi:hypothetical protein [Clostridium sp.]|uniref:PD-(D/E)XK nuclease domain-containing protein n=1 Tax=Clostridium sp. TaxID=1506 RepID=UPI0026394D7A|nr:hypothetical protein [Clostridium sp.]
MNYDLKLKVSIKDFLGFLEEKIKELYMVDNVESIDKLLKEITSNMKEYVYSINLISDLRKNTDYIKSDFSKLKNEENIRKARDRTLLFLEDLKMYFREERYNLIDYKTKLDEETSILILKRILNNFYSHIKSMYIDKVHGRGTIKQENLEKIKIGNEYDVQRILYSLIKPIFPDARTEVVDDESVTSVRYDIEIESCNTVIEVKCTRPSLSERNLNEELGADSFHYSRKNIMFFIYDKENIISNIEEYKKVYNNKFNNKLLDIVIIQPVNL